MGAPDADLAKGLSPQRYLQRPTLEAVQLCAMSAAARLPTFLIATATARSSSGLSSEIRLVICPECFRKAEELRSLPRGARATIRTRLSSAPSTRLTRAFAT